MQVAQEFIFLQEYKADLESSIHLDLKDIDQDGSYELITNESGRGGNELLIFSFNGKGFQQIVKKYYESQSSDGIEKNFMIEPPYLIEKYENPMEKKKWQKKYKLVNQKLVEEN